jgi:hypothetical protein
MIYVNMTDKFLSGWGLAGGGRSYLCIACETLEQAKAIERAAHDRPEMIRITMSSKPRRARSSDHVSIRSFAEMGGSWRTYWHGKES